MRIALPSARRERPGAPARGSPVDSRRFPESSSRRGEAFGFAGINAHAVLEEHAASADGVTPGAILEWDTEAFLLAADDRSGLADLVGWLATD